MFFTILEGVEAVKRKPAAWRHELTSECLRPRLHGEARGASPGDMVFALPRGAEKKPLEPDSVRTDGGKLSYLALLPIAPCAHPGTEEQA